MAFSAFYIPVVASHAWNYKGIATCPSPTESVCWAWFWSVCWCRFVLYVCGECVVWVSMHVRTDTTSAYTDERLKKNINSITESHAHASNGLQSQLVVVA